MEGVKSAQDLTAVELQGKKVLVRLDLNFSLQNGEVSDDYRLVRALPFLKELLARGAKLVLLSHLGGAGESLLPVSRYLQKFLPHEFVETFDEVAVERGLEKGSTVLLENLRRDRGEENNLAEFAEKLAKFGDLYINEAFASSHREHASIVRLPKLLPAYAGPILLEEVQELSRAFTPGRPFIFILGGAKFVTKVPVLKKFMYLADQIFIFGALANSFFKELGYETGVSLTDEHSDTARQFLKFEKIVLPVDVRVRRGGEVLIKKPDELEKGDDIIDAGVDSIEVVREALTGAKFALWNGPLGRFEFGFRGGTEAVAKLVAESSAYSVVGGGDTLAAIHSLNLLDQFDFVSTGGGAMLDFLAEGTLPGIEALKA